MVRPIERRLARLERTGRANSAPLTVLHTFGYLEDSEDLWAEREEAALASHVAQHGEPVGEVQVIHFIRSAPPLLTPRTKCDSDAAAALGAGSGALVMLAPERPAT